MIPCDDPNAPTGANRPPPLLNRRIRAWMASAASLGSAAVGVLCPACIPALAALLLSLGVSMGAVEQFVRPLLIALLVAAVTSLVWSARQHRRWWIVLTGATGAALIYTGRYVWLESLAVNQALLWTGAVVLVGSSLFNFRLRRACRCCDTPVGLNHPGSGDSRGES